MSRMFRLRERWGRFGFALATSLIWALPMAAWAGSVDLVGGPGPWIAFAIGAVLLVAWVVLLLRLHGTPVTERRRRYDVHAMSRSERRWNAALALFGIGLIAFFNGAATVDWAVLTPSLEAFRPGSVALAVGLLTFVVVMFFGVVLSWSRANAAYQQRRKAG